MDRLHEVVRTRGYDGEGMKLPFRALPVFPQAGEAERPPIPAVDEVRLLIVLFLSFIEPVAGTMQRLCFHASLNAGLLLAVSIRALMV